MQRATQFAMGDIICNATVEHATVSCGTTHNRESHATCTRHARAMHASCTRRGTLRCNRHRSRIAPQKIRPCPPRQGTAFNGANATGEIRHTCDSGTGPCSAETSAMTDGASSSCSSLSVEVLACACNSARRRCAAYNVRQRNRQHAAYDVNQCEPTHMQRTRSIFAADKP